MRQFAQGHEHSRYRTFGIASPAAEEASVPASGRELALFRVHGVQVRRKQDPLTWLARGRKTGKEIRTPGGDRLKFHIKPSPSRGGRQEVSDLLFAGVWVFGRQEGRVHAGQRNQFA